MTTQESEIQRLYFNAGYYRTVANDLLSSGRVAEAARAEHRAERASSLAKARAAELLPARMEDA